MKLHFEKLIKSILQEAVTYDQLINYIRNNVKEVDVEQYSQRIWNAYQDESNTKGRQMTPKEFVEDMYDTIGWDWVKDESIPDDPVTATAGDVREMIASVGWGADDGMLLEPFDFSMWDEDEAYYNSWLESQPPEFVDFKKGAMEVMNYAKQYGATTQDLAELKKHLIELGKDYKDQQFFLYGIEADLSLGVI